MLQIVFFLLLPVYGSASLEFLSTGRVTLHKQPSFEQLTVFDGVTISFCDSRTRREQFKSRLKSTQIPEDCSVAYVDILESVYDIQEHVNYTVNVVQRRRGCSNSTDGSVSGFEAWAVNGVDFLTFEPGTLKWTTRSPSAIRLQQAWNRNKARNFLFAHFIKYQCPRIIKKTTLTPVSERTVVHIFAKSAPAADEVQLRCHVTSSDKSVSSLRLIGNGAPKVSWVSEIGPLPGGDGSRVIRLKAGVSIKDSISNQFGCMVQTEKGNISTFWTKSPDGASLDGRCTDCLVSSKIITALNGFVAVIAVGLVMSCAMIALLNIIKIRRQPLAPPHRPELRKQFESFIQNSTLYPDLKHILLSLLYGPKTPEGQLNSFNQWLEIMERENIYDPEFYGGRVS